mgnify:CR=1 FL=1
MATISEELTRIENAKTNIKTSIENKGVSVPTGSLLSAMPSYIDQIPVLDPDDFVKKSGDTMTGDLSISHTGENKIRLGAGALTLNANASTGSGTIDGVMGLTLTSTGGDINLTPLHSSNKAYYNGNEIATTADIPSTSDFVKKDGSVAMTGTLKLNTGCNIVAGEDTSSGGDFTISAKHTPTSSEHSIVLTKVGAGSGIKFIQKSNTSYYGQGYHQLPANDGSTSSNYYTLATVENSLQKSGGTMTGNLTFEYDEGEPIHGINLTSNVSLKPTGSYGAELAGDGSSIGIGSATAYLKGLSSSYVGTVANPNAINISDSEIRIGTAGVPIRIFSQQTSSSFEGDIDVTVWAHKGALELTSDLGITLDTYDDITITSQDGGIAVSGDSFVYNNNNVATQPWVQSNPKYTITVSNGVMTVKENY